MTARAQLEGHHRLTLGQYMRPIRAAAPKYADRTATSRATRRRRPTKDVDYREGPDANDQSVKSMPKRDGVTAKLSRARAKVRKKTSVFK